MSIPLPCQLHPLRWTYGRGAGTATNESYLPLWSLFWDRICLIPQQCRFAIIFVLHGIVSLLKTLRGVTSVDWFYGFKCHIIINEIGEFLATQLTPANIDDRKPIIPNSR